MLHTLVHPESVCLKGRGIGDGPYPLIIFLDSPNKIENQRHRGMVSDATEWLLWAFRRMSILNGVYLDYVVKCNTSGNKEFGKKHERAHIVETCSVYRIATLHKIKPTVIVAMGKIACSAFLGQEKVGLVEGTNWIPNEPFVREHVSHVWASYSAAYPLQDPAESVTVFRTLWQAAIEAGLNPTINKEVTPFDYGF